MWKSGKEAEKNNYFVNISNLPATSERVQERGEHEQIFKWCTQKRQISFRSSAVFAVETSSPKKIYSF